MKTDIANPARKRDALGQFTSKKKGKSHRKGSSSAGRRNPGNPAKGRKGSGSSHRGGSYRRNPDGLNGGEIFAGFAGGVAARAALQKVGGDREADGTLTGTHWLTLAGSIWASKKVAAWAGAGHDAQCAFEGGVCAIAGSLLVDEKAPDMAKAHLFPMTKEGAPRRAATSITTTTATETTGLGATKDRPMSRDRYLQLAGVGQAPPGGAYVQHPDGAVYFYPPSMSGVGRESAGDIQLPANARPGMVLVDDDTQRRVRLELRDGRMVAVPIPPGSRSLSGSRDEYMTAAMQ